MHFYFASSSTYSNRASVPEVCLPTDFALGSDVRARAVYSDWLNEPSSFPEVQAGNAPDGPESGTAGCHSPDSGSRSLPVRQMRGQRTSSYPVQSRSSRHCSAVCLPMRIRKGGRTNTQPPELLSDVVAGFCRSAVDVLLPGCGDASNRPAVVVYYE